MTPEQLSQVEALVARLRTEPAFAPAFYARLFAAAPETETLFGDVDAQAEKLSDELGGLVGLLGNLEALEQRAGDLGQRHRGYNVRAGHYEAARQCMEAAIDDVLGEDFDASTRVAWARAYNLVAELMMSGGRP